MFLSLQFRGTLDIIFAKGQGHHYAIAGFSQRHVLFLYNSLTFSPFMLKVIF